MKVLREITTRHMRKKVGDTLTKAEQSAYRLSMKYYLDNGFVEKPKSRKKKVK